ISATPPRTHTRLSPQETHNRELKLRTFDSNSKFATTSSLHIAQPPPKALCPGQVNPCARRTAGIVLLFEFQELQRLALHIVVVPLCQALFNLALHVHRTSFRYPQRSHDQQNAGARTSMPIPIEARG